MVKKQFDNNIDLENEIINYYFEQISVEDLKHYALKTIKNELYKDGSVWVGYNFIEKQWDNVEQKEYYIVKEFEN